jgi:uncharacterized delta-60 repeat protein
LPHYGIGRLNSDGSVDTSFVPGLVGEVYSLAGQEDGRILVAGYFYKSESSSEPENIARINPDGTLDVNYNPWTYEPVNSMVLQADGKIVVGGSFRMLNGEPRRYLGRLNSDGTLDTAFNPGVSNNIRLGSDVWSLAVQTDGRIVVGGFFTELAGQSREFIGRLNADGTLDATFNPGADRDVLCLAIQADGRILAGGSFTSLGGQPRNRIGRLNATAPATQGLAFDGSSITWLRGGASPEVSRATFDYSPDGLDWFALGFGTRIDGGWELTGLSLSDNAIIRAQGYVAGGYGNGSSWFVRSWAGVPTPRLHALGIDNNGFRFTFESVPGVDYVIEQRNSFTVGDWTTLEKRSASRSLETVTDTSAVGNMRFYRVTVVP